MAVLLRILSYTHFAYLCQWRGRIRFKFCQPLQIIKVGKFCTSPKMRQIFLTTRPPIQNYYLSKVLVFQILYRSISPPPCLLYFLVLWRLWQVRTDKMIGIRCENCMKIRFNFQIIYCDVAKNMEVVLTWLWYLIWK